MVVGTLKAKKSFFPLSATTPKFFNDTHPKTGTVCCLFGAPVELAQETGERGTFDHILQATQFAARAQVIEEANIDDFDYLKVGLFAGQHGFPLNFQGFSGGGLWNFPLLMNSDIGESSMSSLYSELVGVAFFQSAVMEGTRRITCHGPRSIYNTLVEQVPN